MLYTDHEAFLTELSKMFKDSRENGKSVWITMKRYDGRTGRNPRKPNDKPRRPKKGAPEAEILDPGCDLQPKEYKCMIRAKLGDRKISAAIGGKDMNKFQTSYSNLINSNVTGLNSNCQSTPSKAATKSTATSPKSKVGRNK